GGGGTGDGAGRAGQPGDGVHGDGDGGVGEQPGERDARGDAERGGGERGGDVRQFDREPGGDGLHADGGGRGSDDGEQRGLQHHARGREPVGVHSAAQLGQRRRRDHAGSR